MCVQWYLYILVFWVCCYIENGSCFEKTSLASFAAENFVAPDEYRLIAGGHRDGNEYGQSLPLQDSTAGPSDKRFTTLRLPALDGGGGSASTVADVRRACQRIPITDATNLVMDTTGLSIYKITWVEGSAGLSQSHSLVPFANLEHALKFFLGEIYFCCENCDEPMLHSPVAQSWSLSGSSIMYNLFVQQEKLSKIYMWCANAVLGRSTRCLCPDNTFLPSCEVGEYRTNCKWQGDQGECVPCTNGGPGAVYSSSGRAEKNDCDNACSENSYYNRDEHGCVPCTVCEDGYRVSQRCSGVIQFWSHLGEGEQGFEEQHDMDTRCAPCQLGYTTDPNDSETCIPCGFGNVAKLDGHGCVPCEPYQYTMSPTSSTCHSCEIGQESEDGQRCVDCQVGQTSPKSSLVALARRVPGTYRADGMPQCAPCPRGSVQPYARQGHCEICIDGVAQESGMAICTTCNASFYPNPTDVHYNDEGDLVRQQGSWMCLPCDRHRVPSDDAVFTWDADCTWKCKAGYYQDIRQGECVSCDATCTGVGMYRPQCTGTETRLPTCIACSIDSINADMWNATLGVNYEYTEQGGCAYACLPGFSNSSNRCAPCTQQNPPNSSFVGTNCEFRCNRGFKEIAGSCVACGKFEHPRTLAENANIQQYFGDNDQYVDFGVCQDGDTKEYGWLENEYSTVPWPHCGNGVLERKHEECDDGNELSGDGCSSECKLEGGFHSCWTIGESCKPHCGFTDTEMYAFYLTDPFCTLGHKPVQSRRPCGDTCPLRRLREYHLCNSQNQGCIDCEAGVQYINTATASCSMCGEECDDGYYPSTCAPLPANFSIGVDELTAAHKGCLPCEYRGDALPEAVVFIGP
eukprot:2765090-Rhodomonas_salina.1